MATMKDRPAVAASTAGPSVKQVTFTRRQWAWQVTWHRLCREAAGLVLKVMRPACTSGPLAWILTYLFTLGNVMTGLPPARQSDRDLISMTALVSSSFHGISLLATYALSLRNFHRMDGSLWSFTQLTARLARETWVIYYLAQVLVVEGTYALVSIARAFSSEFKLHLYLACALNSLYRASVDEASRSIYQRETLEGVERGHVNDAPYWRRYAQAVGRSINFAVIAMLAASLVHICSALDMLNSSFASLKFSVASVVLKSIVLTVTKHIALRHGGNHLRKIYVLTAVPTVLINTQVRLVLLQNVKSGSSVRSFLELGMLEPLLRMTKVWHLRYTMKQANKSSQSRVSSIAALRARVRRMSAILPFPNSVSRHQTRGSKLVRPATILSSRQSLLHFHAAESHADMCSDPSTSPSSAPRPSSSSCSTTRGLAGTSWAKAAAHVSGRRLCLQARGRWASRSWSTSSAARLSWRTASRCTTRRVSEASSPLCSRALHWCPSPFRLYSVRTRLHRPRPARDQAGSSQQ